MSLEEEAKGMICIQSKDAMDLRLSILSLGNGKWAGTVHSE